MKHYLLVIFLTLVATDIPAQVLTSSANAPREGDLLHMVLVAPPDVGETGRERLWDFSDLHELDGKLRVEHLLPSDTTDTLMAIARRTRRYTLLRGDTLLSPGTENNQWLIRYTMPETLLRYPFAYGDSLSAPFHGTSQYCERTYAQVYGLSSVKADASGTMVTPEGDTLRHVLRVHVLRTEGTLPLPVYTEPAMRLLLDSLPAFTADSVYARLQRGSDMRTTDACYFFAEGYRYPILTITTTDHGESSFTEAFYLSPREQETLAWDPVNERLREGVDGLPASGGANVNGGNTYLLAQGGQGFDPSGPGGSPLSSWSLTATSDGQQGRLSYNLSHETSFAAAIFTSDGKTVWLLPESDLTAGQHTAGVDLSRCTRGVFTLTLWADGRKETAKITVK
jgi:hypothetical protein